MTIFLVEKGLIACLEKLEVIPCKVMQGMIYYRVVQEMTPIDLTWVMEMTRSLNPQIPRAMFFNLGRVLILQTSRYHKMPVHW